MTIIALVNSNSNSGSPTELMDNLFSNVQEEIGDRIRMFSGCSHWNEYFEKEKSN